MCASCTHSANYVKLKEKVNKSWKVILSSLKREADPRIQFTTFHSFHKEFSNNDITTPLCHPIPPCFIFYPIESRILKLKNKWQIIHHCQPKKWLLLVDRVFPLTYLSLMHGVFCLKHNSSRGRTHHIISLTTALLSGEWRPWETS